MSKVSKFHSLIATNAELGVALVWYPGGQEIHVHGLTEDGRINPTELHQIPVVAVGDGEPNRHRALARMEAHIDTLITLSEMADA